MVVGGLAWLGSLLYNFDVGLVGSFMFPDRWLYVVDAYWFGILLEISCFDGLYLFVLLLCSCLVCGVFCCLAYMLGFLCCLYLGLTIVSCYLIRLRGLGL